MSTFKEPFTAEDGISTKEEPQAGSSYMHHDKFGLLVNVSKACDMANEALARIGLSVFYFEMAKKEEGVEIPDEILEALHEGYDKVQQAYMFGEHWEKDRRDNRAAGDTTPVDS